MWRDFEADSTRRMQLEKIQTQPSPPVEHAVGSHHENAVSCPIKGLFAVNTDFYILTGELGSVNYRNKKPQKVKR